MPLDSANEARDERSFWIGDKFVEPQLNQITANGQTQQVERQTMNVLLHLAAHAEQPVSRESILESVWAGATPNDEGLTQAICKLRKALGDRPGEAKVIQTIRKVGYRLVESVSFSPAPPQRTLWTSDIEDWDGKQTRHIRIRINGQWAAGIGLLLVSLFAVALAT